MERYTLKTARDRTGLSQGDAADKLGITRQTLSRYENGETYPDVHTILNMQKLYQVSFEQLIFLHDEFENAN